MELQVTPRCIEEIYVYENVKRNIKPIKNAGLEFDHNGECRLMMEFYDGVAYEITGTGLILRYPTIAEVAKSERMQTVICDYIGIYDGGLNQFDIALSYGKLELSDKDSDKVIHCTLKERKLRDETLILMSADIYEKVYNISDDFMDYQRAARIVRTFADEFEKELDWQGGENEDRDYILELEKFEEKALKELDRKFNIDSKFD